jgi:ABC-2 type transport system permease protein
MEFLKDTWYLYLRLAKATVRMPTFVIMSIVQPVLWVVLFGQLFGSVARVPGFESTSYIQYIAPGIAVITALFGSAFTGIGLLQEMDSGFLHRLLATPARRSAIITARVGVASSQVMLQATIILLMTFVLGARPGGGVAGLVLVYLGAGLMGASMAAFSSALALLTRRQELIIAFTNFLIMPMVYLSSTLMARELMPGWIRATSRFNPVDWGVQAARIGFEGGSWSGAVFPVGLLVLFTLACGTLATAAFGRYRRAI